MNPLDALVNQRRFDGRRSQAERALRWPGGAGLAVSFVLNIEEGAEFAIADGDAHNEAVHEITHRLEAVPDYCLGTHFEYGARVGYRRIVQRFVTAGLPLTLNVCGRALQRTPWVAEDALRHGWELCGHGWQWVSPATMPEAEETQSIAATAGVIRRLTGRGPAGWHCKGSRSAHTRRLLQAHGGFLYDSDDYGDDLPHLLPVPPGHPPHVVLPYGFDTNDMRFFDRGGFVHAADFSAYVVDAIDTLAAEAANEPRMLTIGLHTRIIGRPARISGLDAVLRHLAQLRPAAAVMTRESIARHWLAQAGAPAPPPGSPPAPAPAC